MYKHFMETNILPGQIQKYVRFSGNEIIIFCKSIEHLAFKHLNPITAGSCIIDPKKRKVHCFGLSITLHLQADEKEDTKLATLQIFGDKLD